MNIQEKVKDIFSSKLRGFETPSDKENVIIEVVEVLCKHEVSIEIANSILRDVSKIIPAITKVS